MPQEQGNFLPGDGNCLDGDGNFIISEPPTANPTRRGALRYNTPSGRTFKPIKEQVNNDWTDAKQQ